MNYKVVSSPFRLVAISNLRELYVGSEDLDIDDRNQITDTRKRVVTRLQNLPHPRETLPLLFYSRSFIVTSAGQSYVIFKGKSSSYS